MDHVRNSTCSACGVTISIPEKSTTEHRRHTCYNCEVEFFACGLCTDVFTRKDSLVRHLKAGHNNEDVFLFCRCGLSVSCNNTTYLTLCNVGDDHIVLKCSCGTKSTIFATNCCGIRLFKTKKGLNNHQDKHDQMAVQDSNNINPVINDTKETVHSFKTSEFDASNLQSTDCFTNEVDLVDDDLLLPQSLNQVPSIP